MRRHIKEIWGISIAGKQNKKYSQWASIFVLFCLPLTFSLDKQKRIRSRGMKWWRLRCLCVYNDGTQCSFSSSIRFKKTRGSREVIFFPIWTWRRSSLPSQRTMNDGPTSDQCLCLCLSERKQLLSYCFTFIVFRCDLASSCLVIGSGHHFTLQFWLYVIVVVVVSGGLLLSIVLGHR